MALKHSQPSICPFHNYDSDGCRWSLLLLSILKSYTYVDGLHRRSHRSWKELTLHSDVCHWKERGVTRDATLAAKLYAKPTGCVSPRGSCIAALLCIICVSLPHGQSGESLYRKPIQPLGSCSSHVTDTLQCVCRMNDAHHSCSSYSAARHLSSASTSFILTVSVHFLCCVLHRSYR